MEGNSDEKCKSLLYAVTILFVIAALLILAAVVAAVSTNGLPQHASDRERLFVGTWSGIDEQRDEPVVITLNIDGTGQIVYVNHSEWSGPITWQLGQTEIGDETEYNGDVWIGGGVFEYDFSSMYTKLDLDESGTGVHGYSLERDSFFLTDYWCTSCCGFYGFSACCGLFAIFFLGFVPFIYSYSRV